MKLIVYSLVCVVLALLLTAMVMDITYPMQIVFFGLLLLVVTLLAKGLIEGSKKTSADEQLGLPQA